MDRLKDSLRDPGRVASSSLRGYYYQTLHAVRCWLKLAPTDILLCEGNEDLDHRLSNGDVVEEQVTDTNGNFTENSPKIRQSTINFLKGFVHHRRRGTAVQFIFRTTAQLGAARTPVLEEWLRGMQLDSRAFTAALEELIRDSGDREADQALQHIIKSGDLHRFMAGVSWIFGECNYHELRRAIATELAADDRTRHLDAHTLSQVVIERVLHASCASRIADRALTRRHFQDLVDQYTVASLCRQQSPANSGRSTLHLGVAYDELEVCAVILRSGDPNHASSLLAAALQCARTHPLYDESTESWTGGQTVDALLSLDCDLFICLTLAQSNNPAARISRAILTAANQAKVRAGTTTLYTIENAAFTLGVGSGFTRQSDSTLLSQLATRVAGWVLTRTSTIDVLHTKVKCLSDLRTGTFYSQDEPFTISSLPPRGPAANAP